MPSRPRPSTLELLRIQAEPALDPRGRIAGCQGITVASGPDGQAMWIGADLPDPVAGELAAAFDRAPPPADPAEPPPALEVCAHILAAAGCAVEHSCGPSYVFPSAVRAASDAAIVRSGGPGVDALRGANPGNWHPVEWDELLDGRLGPWAIATQDGCAISVCHTPGRVTARAAECGVWTDPRFRGRGHAAATAAAWVALIRAPGRHLFYSTDADNGSSQRVARRLDLRPIGTTWRLHRARTDAGALHPLCSLRACPIAGAHP